MRLPVPRVLRRALLGGVAAGLRMDLSEAARPIDAYRSVGDLFTRELREGARRWPATERVAGSPVDGIVGQSGRITDSRLLQAKGRWYSLAELLDDERQAPRFTGGSYVTIYLSPRHYHRIHAPVSGTISRARHVPGRLLPVNTPAVRWVDQLFPRNERLVAYVDGSPLGGVAVVAVGAFNVGRITASFDSALVTNRRRALPETHLYHPPVEVGRGEELMTFHLGSTVVLLFESAVELRPMEPGQPILLGEALTS